MQFENAAHGLNGKLIPMITNEGVLYPAFTTPPSSYMVIRL
jgi:hypothetical protein